MAKKRKRKRPSRAKNRRAQPIPNWMMFLAMTGIVAIGAAVEAQIK